MTDSSALKLSTLILWLHVSRPIDFLTSIVEIFENRNVQQDYMYLGQTYGSVETVAQDPPTNNQLHDIVD